MGKTKLQELMNDTDFMEKVIEANSEQEVKEMFKERGLDLNGEDMKLLSSKIKEAAQESGVMPDEELEGVAGGFNMLGTGYKIVDGTLVTAGESEGIADSFKRGASYTGKWWKKI